MRRPPPLKGSTEQKLNQLYRWLFELVEEIERLEVNNNGTEH